MSGAGKKKPKGSATAKRLLALFKRHGKRGMTNADLVKFLVIRPDRKRKNKAAPKGKAAAPIRASQQSVQWGTPNRYDHSKEQRPEEAATKAAAAAAAIPPQTQFVVVHEHKNREVEAKDIVPYEAGDEIPAHAKVLAVWKGANGVPKQRDVTTMLKKAMDDAMSTVKDAKEGKEKAAEDAKQARDEKHKSDAEAKRSKAEATAHAAEIKQRAAKDTMRAKWEHLDVILVHDAAKKAGILLKEPGAKSAKSRKTLVEAAWRKGMKENKDMGDGLRVGDMKDTNPIYHDYEIARFGPIGTKHHDEEEISGKGQVGGNILDEFLQLVGLRKKNTYKLSPEMQERVNKSIREVNGNGRLDRSTSNTEIDRAMSKVPGYQGCVPSDDTFEVKGKPNPGGVSWVMNLYKAGQPGSHWVAVLITPRSVEYSDSFGDHPTPSVQQRIVAAGKRLWPENVKTLKINKIKHQDERTSTCGFHAMKFIRDRMSGKSFVDVTGYGGAKSQVRKNEAEVAAFEKRYPKFVQVGNGILDHPGDNMPHAVRAMLEKHGNEPITSIEVVRAPVQSAVQKVLNVVTLGAYKKALAENNYDQLFHLAIVVNGKYSIEKNATVQFVAGARSGGERRPAKAAAGALVQDLFKAGTAAGFWLYDPRTNNCQDFIVTVLNSVGALTPELRKFVKQDADAIFRSMPGYASKLAKFVTDLGGRVDGVKDRIGKLLRGKGLVVDDPLPGQYKGKPPKMGDKGPYSWLENRAIPRPTLLKTGL